VVDDRGGTRLLQQDHERNRHSVVSVALDVAAFLVSCCWPT
jgi:hypothetical protein